MARKRTMRPDERALWARVAKSVTPIAEDRLRKLETPEETPSDANRKMDTAARAYDTGLRLPPARREPATYDPPTPHDRSGEKRVRRGRVEIDGRIDLHGLTQDQALRSLRHFLQMAFASGYRTVLVITGKGFKSRDRDTAPWEQVEEPGVLRRKLPEWLGLPEFSQYVSGFAKSHARHGGSGAFYVTLRTRSRN
ncbi:hypothetical protein AWH62_06445 [Maricaulis sp. W15]|uniref:DNA-nicking Smr family endonuclease n=1 Tax=Maricaulis maris TaxID=74318 RepID=A0A495D5Q3_9PROT|nr:MULTISPECIES: Smr/MutS family protein [Maricaulis]OLF75451.1 hypothetical protein AWH62_06445 [Maricaulis sp. W15]RKQ96749.1 DNA-nicking Smr family endonuclease [Maricaulis maris]